MTPDEILKLWRDYEGRGSDAVVAFARAVELAQRERCIKVCEDLAFEHESCVLTYRMNNHFLRDIWLGKAGTARALADKILFL